MSVASPEIRGMTRVQPLFSKGQTPTKYSHRIFIYGCPAMKVSSLHNLIECYHTFERLQITKKQKYKQTKFIIEIEQNEKDVFIETMAFICDKYKWKISEEDKIFPNPNSYASITKSNHRNTIMTWNICGLKSKRNHLRQQISDILPSVVALQETRIFDGEFPFTHPEYYMLHNPAVIPGQPGIILGFHKNLIHHEIRGIEGNLILAKCFIPETDSYWIFGSVYIPNNQHRLEVLNKICDRILDITWKYDFPIAIMGDWNLEPDRLRRKLQQRGCGNLKIKHITGSDISRYSSNPNSRWSALDHIVVNDPASQLIYKVKIKRHMDSSDHWPIVGKYLSRNAKLAQETADKCSNLAIDLKACQKQADAIANSNYWDCLLEIGSEISISNLQQVSSQIIDEFGLKIDKPRRMRKRFISSRSRRLAKRASRIHLEWIKEAHSSGHSPKSQEIFNEWKRARKETRYSIKLDDSKNWKKFCKSLECQFDENNLQKGWSIVKGLIGKSRKSIVRTLNLKNKEGEIEMEPEKIEELWRDHFSKLASPNDPNEKSVEYWNQKTGSVKSQSDEVPERISFAELKRTLGGLGNNKAPGIDGIPNPFLKILASENTKSLKAISICFDHLLLGGEIIASENTSTIIPIPKPGCDSTDPNNYRGISLINGFLKSISKIIYRRLLKYCTEKVILSSAQAGFRPREEAIAQVVTLIDIIQRRKANCSPTFSCFIDFKKAFDTVPIGALIWKLHKYNVPGYIIDFVTKLYGSAWATTKGTSNPFQILQGVRQGCPLSGLLFNIFINDIFDEMDNDLMIDAPESEISIHGLLYADDVVILANSPQNLQIKMNQISKWANTWNMKFGIAKSAVVIFSPEFNHSTTTFNRFTLDGQTVEIKNEYKYLGIQLDNNVDLGNFIKSKKKTLTRILNMIAPVLKNNSFSMSLRKRIFDAFLIGNLNYGLELLAGRKQMCQQLQIIINQAMRMITGTKRQTPIISLSLELNCPLVEVRAISTAIRLFNKSQSLSSTLAKITSPSTADTRKLKRVERKLTWTVRVDEMRRKITPGLEAVDWQKIKASIQTQRFSMSTYLKSKAAQRYIHNNFEKTNYITKWEFTDRLWKLGHKLLLYGRIGYLWTKSKGVKTGTFTLNDHDRDHCILCDDPVELDSEVEIAHILVECKYFQKTRDETGLSREVKAISEALQRVNEQLNSKIIANYLFGASNATLAFWKGVHDLKTRPLEIRVIEFLGLTLWTYYAKLRETTGYSI